MSKCNPDVEEWLKNGEGKKTLMLQLNASLTTNSKFESKLKSLGITEENDMFSIFPVFVVNAELEIARKISELEEVNKIEFPAKRKLY